MKKIIDNKLFFNSFFALTVCIMLCSCKDKLTLEERMQNLETKISKEDCKDFTNKALQSVLENLRDVNFETIINGVKEDLYAYNLEENLYVQIVVSGNAKGKYKGVDSIYYFYFYGRIPEKLADSKEFDEDGYNFSLKNGSSFVYSNKENVDSLNNELVKSRKESEELRKKDFVINDTKVRYDGREGNVLIYTSSRELTPDEIAESIEKNIESEGVAMIQFYNGSDKYADYVYKTSCIIFVKYQDKIYKKLGRTAVKL